VVSTTSPHKPRSRFPVLTSSSSERVWINLRYSSSLNSRNAIGLDIATPGSGVVEERKKILARWLGSIDSRAFHEQTASGWASTSNDYRSSTELLSRNWSIKWGPEAVFTWAGQANALPAASAFLPLGLAMLWTLADYEYSLAPFPPPKRCTCERFYQPEWHRWFSSWQSIHSPKSVLQRCCGSNSPAALIQTHHTNKDFLQSAVLKNVGNQTITEYRIGWVVVHPSGKSKVGLGLPVTVPDGFKPGETVDVPSQQVSTDFWKEGASAVVFFVTDVSLAGNGSWKTDLRSSEEAARGLEQKVRSSS
jgi:hypothetical protein